ncbi:MAG: adenylate kinase [Acidimicrobiia bacterium]|nr:adenylate kinase [Acidimicrobiia bacterium]
MSRGPRLVVLGRQGAGKGTQAAMLAEHYGVSHLSTGDLFRAAARAGTPFGLEAQRYMDDGNLVPDDIVVGVVEERLLGDGDIERGFVLDGFPRTEPQARELERVLEAHPLDGVIELLVPTEVVLERMEGRRVCEQCGATYHVHSPPRENWTCDVCGGRVVQRDDDTEEAITRRLELYERETRPLTDFYRGRGLLVEVDGVGDPHDVFERVVKAVDRLDDWSQDSW